MIERVYIKENFTIKNAEIELSRGLMVFSGSSGAGKSVLMRSILSIFGLGEATAESAEANIKNFNLPEDFDADDEIVIKQIKKEKVRYFLNGQSIGKSRLKEIGSGYLFHLNHKDYSEFEQKNLVLLIDSAVISSEKEHEKRLKDFQNSFKEYVEKNKKLAKLTEQEKKIEELKDFARYEISKIESVSPKSGEDEELMNVKRLLSKKDKIEDAARRAEEIFAYEHAVNELFELLGESPEAFSDAMNEARGVIENARDSAQELEDVDIEYVLDRIEKISDLTKRYGSIENALAHRDEKIKELQGYEDIDSDRNRLENELKILKKAIDKNAEELSDARKKHLKKLESALNEYLDMLYMPKASLTLRKRNMDETGFDELEIRSKTTTIENLSIVHLRKNYLQILSNDL